eukprot:TRINITY_DN15447_c1_g1_i1.p2 TRINITY_DN15447_c1_g1~~TRINITY_DN15447_c1_g1_i1.p2  ORF type:complete len:255 (+),score=-17.70 TRINITY_DN15447_c1_g1_i1:114-878(+)
MYKMFIQYQKHKNYIQTTRKKRLTVVFIMYFEQKIHILKIKNQINYLRNKITQINKINFTIIKKKFTDINGYIFILPIQTKTKKILNKYLRLILQIYFLQKQLLKYLIYIFIQNYLIIFIYIQKQINKTNKIYLQKFIYLYLFIYNNNKKIRQLQTRQHIPYEIVPPSTQPPSQKIYITPATFLYKINYTTKQKKPTILHLQIYLLIYIQQQLQQYYQFLFQHSKNQLNFYFIKLAKIKTQKIQSILQLRPVAD